MKRISHWVFAALLAVAIVSVGQITYTDSNLNSATGVTAAAMDTIPISDLTTPNSTIPARFTEVALEPADTAPTNLAPPPEVEIVTAERHYSIATIANVPEVTREHIDPIEDPAPMRFVRRT